MKKIALIVFLGVFLFFPNVSAATEGVTGTLYFNSNIDNSPPNITNAQNHSHTIYTSFSYDHDATDESPLDTWTVNDTTNWHMNASTGVLTNNTAIDTLKMHWLNITVNDTNGYTAWATFYINITGVVETRQIGRMVGLFVEENIFGFIYVMPPRDFDANMQTNTIFYSYDQDKLVYKDPNGVVHALY